MKICKDCGGIGFHETWCGGPPEVALDSFVANAHPHSIVGKLFPQEPIRPIRVYQCKDDCCAVQVHGRRFWYVRTPRGRETFTSFRDAVYYATYTVSALPQEVTA